MNGAGLCASGRPPDMDKTTRMRLLGCRCGLFIHSPRASARLPPRPRRARRHLLREARLSDPSAPSHIRLCARRVDSIRQAAEFFSRTLVFCLCGLSTGHAAILPLGCGVLKVRAISSGFARPEPRLHPRSPCQLASDEILPRSVLGIHAVFSFRTRKWQTTAPCQKKKSPRLRVSRLYFHVPDFSLCPVCDPEILQSVRSGNSRNLAGLVLPPLCRYGGPPVEPAGVNAAGLRDSTRIAPFRVYIPPAHFSCTFP